VSRAGVGDAPARRAGAILRRLQATYPDARCSLDFTTPWELLVATVLSAQCTDERVNAVAPGLFARFPDPAAFIEASQAEVAAAIHSTGFHNQKARALRGIAGVVLREYGGRVPRRLDQLVRLPGVGRKTAAVVSGNAFGRRDGIAVDTHVGRLARRLGLSAHPDPVRVELDLATAVPRSAWTLVTHLLIAHGRAICRARTPLCDACVLRDLCPYGLSHPGADPARTVTTVRGAVP